jgi:hypothetical protein
VAENPLVGHGWQAIPDNVAVHKHKGNAAEMLFGVRRDPQQCLHEHSLPYDYSTCGNGGCSDHVVELEGFGDERVQQQGVGPAGMELVHGVGTSADQGLPYLAGPASMVPSAHDVAAHQPSKGFMVSD